MMDGAKRQDVLRDSVTTRRRDRLHTATGALIAGWCV